MTRAPAKRPGSRRRAEAPARKGRGKKGRWYLLIAVLVVLVASALIFAWYYQPLKIYYHEARNERVLGAKLKAVETYNAQLEDEIKSLETTQGVAEYARRELNLVDKGDHVVIVTRDGKPVTASDEASRLAALIDSDAIKKPYGSWTDFLDRIFGSE